MLCMIYFNMNTHPTAFLECDCGETWDAVEPYGASIQYAWDCKKCRQYLSTEDFYNRKVTFYVINGKNSRCTALWKILPSEISGVWKLLPL